MIKSNLEKSCFFYLTKLKTRSIMDIMNEFELEDLT